MALTIPTQFKFKPPNLQHQFLRIHVEVFTVRTTNKPQTCYFTSHNHHLRCRLKPKSWFARTTVLPSFCINGGGEVDASPQQSTPSQDNEALRSSSSTNGDGYVALFVRMLGLDHDSLDREQAIVALWKYSLGGKQYVDAIMQFRGSINLTVNLLRSESSAACEAAAGLLRMISSVNVYRDSVAECGAIEELTGLLRRSSLTSEVKEQSICTLWNLSVDEKLRAKLANTDLLPLLIKFLEDEDIKVKEAAGGVLANLALSHPNHKIMVEAGVIPKMAKLLKTDAEGSKVIRKEARNALLEFAKDEYYRILVVEEGLVLVPLVGAAAYKSFRPDLHSWPSLPDGTEIEQSSKGPSRYGASELLLGLNIQDKNANLEEAKTNAIVGRTQQQFLARIGAIEMENENKVNSESSLSQRSTLLPWMDGVARLVLILGLEDELAVARAAKSIADASINEHMRISFKEAGAVNHLIQLLNHHSGNVKLAAIHALERLSVSNDVCLRIEAEGALFPLINSLKHSEISESSTEMILNILAQVLDPSKEMKSKFYDGPVNGSKKQWDARRTTASAENMDEILSRSTSSLQTIQVVDLLDSVVLARLIEILKTSSPNLQRKAASILEFLTVSEQCFDKVISAGIESALEAVFQQRILNEAESDIICQQPELHTLEVEEAGLAISSASRLLTRLLDSEQFRGTINSSRFTKFLRDILKSSIPLHNKDWVAACLVKLSSLSGPNPDFENAISMEVTLFETIPRLIEEIKTSFSPEVQEAAVIELNRIISEGVVDSTRAVAAEGAIFALVKLIEEGSGRAVEAALAILYNLSMDSENHSAIIAAGAVPALRKIVLSQRPQWMRALRLLRTLPT
ncbi:unnamed protein product [Ilex paraguariensis]|uniref:ARM repeat superfamily protein n=1 Tax=Ilex paraguariensis TaxID=185542 RepID=A0ABC8QSB4_9AQUA